MPDKKKFTFIVTPRDKRKSIPEYVQGMLCPKCNEPAKDSFGLAGGGFGVYNYCPKCGKIVSKSITED